MNKYEGRNVTKILTYSSPSILQRRQRMLAECWRLIAERGLESFSVREICERTGVSQGTFYNAFGTRENAIAVAVTEFARTVGSFDYLHSENTLDGRLERLVHVYSNMRGQKRYTAALMRVFFSDTLSPTAKRTMVDLACNANRPYIESLQRRRGLLPYIDPQYLAETWMITEYGVLHYWASGSLTDEDLVGRCVQNFLLVAAGVTRGAAAREVKGWCEEVSRGGPRWLDLRQTLGPNGASEADLPNTDDVGAG